MKFPRVVSIQKSPNFYVTKVCLIQSQLSKLEIQNAAKDYLKGISSCSDFPWHLIEAWKGHDWYVRSCSKLFFFCLVVSFLAFRESVWFQEVGETDLMDCEPPLLGVTFGRIVQVHFSFVGIVWVMVLFLLPVVFQTKVARLTALVYLPGMVVRTEKGRCFVVTLVSEWGDGMYHVTCWVTLACGLLCTFVVSSETEACPAGTSVGSLRDSSKSWGIVLALGLRARAGGEQDGSVRLMLMERCSCAGSTLKWK